MPRNVKPDATTSANNLIDNMSALLFTLKSARKQVQQKYAAELQAHNLNVNQAARSIADAVVADRNGDAANISVYDYTESLRKLNTCETLQGQEVFQTTAKVIQSESHLTTAIQRDINTFRDEFAGLNDALEQAFDQD